MTKRKQDQLNHDEIQDNKRLQLDSINIAKQLPEQLKDAADAIDETGLKLIVIKAFHIALGNSSPDVRRHQSKMNASKSLVFNTTSNLHANANTIKFSYCVPTFGGMTEKKLHVAMGLKPLIVNVPFPKNFNLSLQALANEADKIKTLRLYLPSELRTPDKRKADAARQRKSRINRANALASQAVAVQAMDETEEEVARTLLMLGTPTSFSQSRFSLFNHGANSSDILAMQEEKVLKT